MENTERQFYLVYYFGGSYSDFFRTILFITQNEQKAQEYCEKFNKIVEKWRAFYNQFQESEYELKPEYEEYFERWHHLNQITLCTYVNIETR
jgi:hypothetical protein